MLLPLLSRGLLLGFLIAAPVGPIGVLCIRRTLAEGRLAGFASGLGAALADAMYGAVAAFGLTVVSRFLVAQGAWLGVVGGLFLVYLGVRTWTSRAASLDAAPRAGPRGGAGALGSTFGLTLTNPMTILSFAAVFAGAGLATQRLQAVSAAALVLGVFLGSAAWWFLLSGLVSVFRSRLDVARLTWVNRVSGLLIGAFGAVALLRSVPWR